MLGKLNSSFFNKIQQESLKQTLKRTQIKIVPKQASSEIINQQKQKAKYKVIKSQPVLEQINKSENGFPSMQSMQSIKSLCPPRLIRITKKQSSINRPQIKFTFNSPPATSTKIPKLIHQPAQPKKHQEKPTINRLIIPPSDLVHDKFKNFQQNPQGFLVDIDEQLDKVFKKSITSIIRNCQKVPVLDSSIHDSTDLLKGYREK